MAINFQFTVILGNSDYRREKEWAIYDDSFNFEMVQLPTNFGVNEETVIKPSYEEQMNNWLIRQKEQLMHINLNDLYKLN